MNENGKKTRLMIIDDNRALVEEMKYFLESHGYEVSCAYDGLSGLEAAKKEKPCLIILDITMPKMDGRDVLVGLKKDKNTKDIPVIILTAYFSQQFDVDYGFELGAYDYVTKPFDEILLLRKISSALGWQDT